MQLSIKQTQLANFKELVQSLCSSGVIASLLEGHILVMAQADEQAKPAEQVPQSMGTNDPNRTGFLAPPASSAPRSLASSGAEQVGMAVEAGNAPTEIPSGIQADTSAIPDIQPTGEQAMSLCTVYIFLHTGWYSPCLGQ